MLLVAVGAATGCHKQLARAQPPAVVKVVAVQSRSVQLVKEWVATIDGSTTAEIRPQVSGYIQQVNYKEGSRIDVGELLFTIDDRPFVAAVKKAQGDYETALAQLAKARADVARYTPLVVDHAISHEQLDDARAAVQAGEATMAGAKGTLDSANLNLKWSKVRSPIAGLTGLAQVRVGALVNTNQILTIVSTVSSMRASFSVSQQDYLRYADEMNAPNASEHPGVEFELILIDGRIYPHRARQVFVNRQIDATTGTLQIQALFPNPDGLLRPGLFAKVRLHGSNEVAPVVPERAVSQLQGQYQVTVIDSQQRAQIRRIDVGLLVDHVYAVDKGLRPGELVVVEGQQNILPGAKVNVEQLNGPESQAHFGMRN
ncbi:MAG TPA: efflux RND transporter periplasmic adaptor subunit [Polyangia bacterium]|nr:efflux RND transporter periplasmic adaptor subunit [Polyangia bacterium]